MREFCRNASYPRLLLAGLMASGLAVFSGILIVQTVWQVQQMIVHDRENAKSREFYQAQNEAWGVKKYAYAKNDAEVAEKIATVADLNDFQVGEGVTDAGMAPVQGLTDLREFRGCFGTIGDESLKYLADKVELRYLNLYDCPNVTDAGVVYLARLTKLEDLDLGHTKVSDAGIANLKGCIALRRLDLGENVFGEGLVHLTGLPNLQEIAWHGEAVNDDSIAKLKQLKELRKVNLNGTGLTDAGLAHLAQCRKLENIYVLSANISDDGIQALGALKNLRKLDVRQTAVTSVGVARLQKALPDCQILYGPYGPAREGEELLHSIGLQIGSLLGVWLLFGLLERLIAKTPKRSAA